MTDPKPIPEDLLKEARAVENATEMAANVQAETLRDLGNQQEQVIDKLCEAEGLDRRRVQLALFVDRGEYAVLKEFESWEQVASQLTEDVDRQENSNLIAMCYAFSLFSEAGIEMPDAARELLMDMAKDLEPQIVERLKGYLYS